MEETRLRIKLERVDQELGDLRGLLRRHEEMMEEVRMATTEIWTRICDLGQQRSRTVKRLSECMDKA